MADVEHRMIVLHQYMMRARAAAARRIIKLDSPIFLFFFILLNAGKCWKGDRSSHESGRQRSGPTSVRLAAVEASCRVILLRQKNKI
jgi:hypothetical protein